MKKSALQRVRAEYQPKLPKALQGPVKLKIGEATQSVADQEEIKNLFPHTYGMPIVEFVREEHPERVEEPFNVGIILSGGQAPGGHNVVSGIFDGINAAWDNGKIGVEAGYGRFKDAGNEVAEDDESGMWKDRASTEAWYGKLTGHFNDRADLSAFYLANTHKANGEQGIDYDSPKAHAWGAGTTVDLGGNFNLDGDFVQTKLNKGNGHANLWTAGLTYGAVDTDKPGTWQLGVHYVKSDYGAMLLGNSALDLTDQLDYGYDNDADVHFWVARAGVALQKGVELDAYYNFAAKASGVDGQHVDDPDDTWGIELNYAF